MDKDKVVQKIRNLLAIAHCQTAYEGEILNAMSHAQRLMDNYHLSEEDLVHEPVDDYKNVDNAQYGKTRAGIGGKIFQWESVLATYVKNLTGCPCYIDNAKVQQFGGKLGKGIVFYGLLEDSQIAAEIYNELRLIISTMAIGLYEKVYKNEGGLYCQGFVSGLFAQLSKQRENDKVQTNGTGHNALICLRRNDLVQYKKDKANDWLTKQGVSLGKPQKSSGARGSYSAYEVGKNDGMSHNVEFKKTRKITN